MSHSNIRLHDPTVVDCGMASNLAPRSSRTPLTGWKPAMMDWLDQMRFTHAITLSWNRGVGMVRARADLRDLMHRVDRSLFGSNFNRVPSEHRTRVVFAFEGTSYDHVHVHSIWRAPQQKWFSLGKMFPRIRGGVWNEVVETGSYKVEACNWFGRNAEITGYVLKEQHRFSEPDTMVWASEFHRAR